ncbi:MAG TPA: hypothetical protein VFR37_00415 [Longimicrobium sp.]|nr:hypothetical protein [Longimicrobium sp.]
MAERASFALRVVDGLELPKELRRLLRPAELLEGRDGRRRRLPRWFFEVPSWEAALQTDLAPHFKVWEFLNVDVREHAQQRLHWPRYLPLAVGLLAAALEVMRREVDTYIHIAANGGYRSPRHRLTDHASPHCWGTAVNIYRVGDDWLDDEKTITKYSRLARRLSPAFWARPYGHGVGETDDHLHLDLGYAVVAPHGGGDDHEPGQSEPLHGSGDEDETEKAEG